MRLRDGRRLYYDSCGIRTKWPSGRCTLLWDINHAQMPISRNGIEIVGWPRSVFWSKKGFKCQVLCFWSMFRVRRKNWMWRAQNRNLKKILEWHPNRADSRCLVHWSMARNIQNTTILCACKDILIGKYKMWIQSVRLVP